MLRSAPTPSSFIRDNAMKRFTSALSQRSSSLHTSRLNSTARRVILPGSGTTIKASRLSAHFSPSLVRPAKAILPTTTTLVARNNHSSAHATTSTVVPADADKMEDTKKSCCSSKKDTTASSSSTGPSCHTKSASSNNHHHHHTITAKPSTASLAFWSDLSSWQVASVNTFRCLVGCTVGDFGMLFYLQSHHPSMAPTVAMGLAMASGITSSLTLETVLLRFSRKTNLTWGEAFKTAMGMSMISMLTMEAVENAVDFHLMGWNNVDFANPAFWRAMGLSAFAGWLAPLPWNYWNFKKRGKSCH